MLRGRVEWHLGFFLWGLFFGVWFVLGILRVFFLGFFLSSLFL